jgi:hypothetical protein
LSGHLDKNHRTAVTSRGLWQRAPLWRATVIGASVATVAAFALLAIDHAGKSAPAKTPPSPIVTQAHPGEAGWPPAAPAPVKAGGAELTPVATAPALEPALQPATAGEEERAQAACHPGLIRAPDVPSIDTRDIAQPNLAHLRFRFWVSGTGVVVRDRLVGGTLGTEAERLAAQQFLYQTLYSIPDIADCRGREMELVGDFFEARNQSGDWETFVNLHPHLWLDPRGILRVSD